MMRLIITLSLLAILIAVATVEQVSITKVYGKLGNDLDAFGVKIYAAHETKSPINTDELIAEINKIHDYWIKREKKLSLVIRHFDLTQISDALIYVKNFVFFDNAEEAAAGLERAKYLVMIQRHSFSTSMHNVM
jgi:hypothetical protein